MLAILFIHIAQDARRVNVRKRDRAHKYFWALNYFGEGHFKKMHDKKHYRAARYKVLIL